VIIMAKKIKDVGSWFQVELDDKDTPNDLEVPYSELAMHTRSAGKMIKPKIIQCTRSEEGDVDGNKVWASYVHKADIIHNNKVEHKYMQGLISELIPFTSNSDMEKYKQNQKYDTKDQRKHLDNICKKLS